MTNTNYTPPVSRLLSLGDVRKKDTLDYLALGLDPDHVPELGLMLLDADLTWAYADEPEVWSSVHARRALGQIGSPAAIESLIADLQRIDYEEDEWGPEELPDVFAALGPVGIPHLAAFLADGNQGLWPRIVGVSCLEKIAAKYPEAQAQCIGIFTDQLALYKDQHPTFNAFFVSALMDLMAVDAAPLIQQAFDAECVDWGVVGDWEEVQVGMGLLKKRLTPAPHFHWDNPHAPGKPLSFAIPSGSSHRRPAAPADTRQEYRQRKSEAKKKRKQQKQARRKQRK